MPFTLRSMLRAAVAWDPFVQGWTRRAYVGLGMATKDEGDYLFDLAQSHKDIFVLQVGANDGKRHDLLRPLIHRYRWRALLLEPLPDIFNALRKNYVNAKNVTLVNAALTDRDGEATIYRVRPGPGVPKFCNELASFRRDVVVKHAYLFAEIEQHVVAEAIAAVSFGTLVKQYGIEKIDVVMIDTEGYDYQILKLVDFVQFRPKLVIYEHAHLSKEDQAAAAQLLSSVGYEVHALRSGYLNTAAIYRGT